MIPSSSFDAVLFDLTIDAHDVRELGLQGGLPIRHFGEPVRLTPDSPRFRPADPTRQLPRAA